VTPVYTKNLPFNISQIVPTTPLKDSDFMLYPSDPLEERRRSRNPFYYFLTFDATPVIDRCHTIYENEEFQKLLKQKFDLVFISGSFSECLEGVVYVFKCPYILMTTMPAPHYVTDRTGFRVPPSFIPTPLIDMPRDMDFAQRFVNTLLIWMLAFLTNTIGAPGFEELYRGHLGNDVPGLYEIQQNLSLILTNTHVSLNFARPTMPNIIEVGGVHCRPTKSLPKVKLQII
jgi:glucuronosyltransferase